MSVNSTSRYTTAEVLTVDDPMRGKHQALAVPAPGVRQFNFTFYQVVEGDTVDNLAYRFFDKGQLWWLIADANPEILDWTTLKAGTVLRVPYV